MTTSVYRVLGEGLIIYSLIAFLAESSQLLEFLRKDSLLLSSNALG